MSRSSPGRYALHEFAKNVSNFRATDGKGHTLKTEHDTPDSWTVTPRNGIVVCSYTLFGDHLDGTYAAIDLTHAHLNLPAVLVWAEGLEKIPATLRFNVPVTSGWKPFTQLIPEEDGTFSAPNLEWMMDSPVELSASPALEWMTANQTFRLALHQQGAPAAAAAFEQMCKAVVAEERGIFGEFPDYDGGPYTFIVDYLPYASSDGMEHRDSTVITDPIDLAESAHLAIGTVSHEFFHSWNVKRMRPKSLEPFDFERADMSSELWFAEGFTNYYGQLVLRRANLSSFDEFVNGMSQAVNAVLTNPGRMVRSAAGMSEQAPFVDAATSIDATNLRNDFISYYTYGQALAFGIDLAIREQYPGKSLDNWMRGMWQKHHDSDQPYTLADLEATLAEVTDESFAHEVFTDHIQGLQPLDYAHLSAPAGLSLTFARPGKVWLGGGAGRINVTGSGLELTGPTLRGSPLYQAGVDRGDEIQDCGNETVKTIAKLDSCFASRKPGDSLTLKVKGRTGIRTVTLALVQDPELTLVPVEREGQSVTPAIQSFRAKWLSSRVSTLQP